MSDSPLKIEWRARDIPLTPTACAGIGGVALTLARRLLRLADSELARYQGAAGGGVLIVSGEADLLPWTDGVLYLGRDPAAPDLLLPTALEPCLPLTLFESALRRSHPEWTLPLAVFPAHRRVVSLSAARPIYRQTLQNWLDSAERETS